MKHKRFRVEFYLMVGREVDCEKVVEELESAAHRFHKDGWEADHYHVTPLAERVEERQAKALAAGLASALRRSLVIARRSKSKRRGSGKGGR